MSRPPDFSYKGYNMSWSEYTGAYAIYLPGKTMNEGWGKTEEACKRTIDKWLKEKK